MIDPDDAIAFGLIYALRDLVEIANRHSQPHLVIEDWFISVASVLIAGQWSGRSLEELMLCTARRIVQDARLAL